MKSERIIEHEFYKRKGYYMHIHATKASRFELCVDGVVEAFELKKAPRFITITTTSNPRLAKFVVVMNKETQKARVVSKDGEKLIRMWLHPMIFASALYGNVIGVKSVK